MIQEKLQQLGLSENEILVYLCVLENANIAPSRIAKKTGLSRPTVYVIGKKLAELELILEETGQTGLHFLALSPEMILRDAEKKEREAKENLSIAKSLLPELTLLPKSQGYSVPKVRFIKEAQINDYLYNKAADWNKSALERDKTWWGVQDSSLVKHYGQWLAWYWKQTNPAIQTKMFTNEKEEGHSFDGQTLSRRQIKYWKKQEHIRTTQLVFGDYVIIFNTFSKPHSLFEIHDAVTAEGLRQVFKGIWETL
jgi:DNA-binding MarR family transcriptional regulator